MFTDCQVLRHEQVVEWTAQLRPDWFLLGSTEFSGRIFWWRITLPETNSQNTWK